MRNLTAPKQYEDLRGSSFDTGCEGLVLFTDAGDRVRLHVGTDGFFYINGVPFGVQGMPPAMHAVMHKAGCEDELTPSMIGAVAHAMLSVVPRAGAVPQLRDDGTLNPAFIAGLVRAEHHASSHAAGGEDAITPANIRAVPDTDPRLSDRRDPRDHASQHAKGQPDAVTPASIGAVPDDDERLHNKRAPVGHHKTHFKNGIDPLSWADVGSVDATMFTDRDRVPHGYPQLNDLGHIDMNLLPGGLPPAPHSTTHATDGVDRILPITIGAAERKHQHGNTDIIDLDASKISTGTIDMARLPTGALDRLTLVDTLEDMYLLTADDVQNGDTVQTLDTGQMYRVVDDTALTEPEAYRVYNAGRAAAVPWEGVEGKPTEYNPHAHAVRHHTGGVDALTPPDIGAPTMAQHNAAEALAQSGVKLAQQGITDAENARLLAVAAQTKADKALADASAANVNADTRALQSDFMALQAAVTALGWRMTTLEAAAVTSTNIRLISGTVLSDGIGALEFEPK